jgi:broad specificity phosphatase PhoE
MTRTLVHLVRHGEVHNPDKVLYGRLPGYRLSEVGSSMAEVAAAALRGGDVVVVRSSPLERAQQTAAPIAAEFGLDVVLDDRLLEAENVFEGRQVNAPMLRRPETWRHLRNPLAPSWGERYQLIAARMMAAAEDARDQARGHEAVCVSHQLPIYTLRRFLEGQRLWHFPGRRECALASITTVEWQDDKLVGVSYRDPAAHLSTGVQLPGA